jgi:hypothetical protein
MHSWEALDPICFEAESAVTSAFLRIETEDLRSASDRLLGIVSRVVSLQTSWRRCEVEVGWRSASSAAINALGARLQPLRFLARQKIKSSHADGEEFRARTGRNIPEPQTNA